MKKPFLSLLVFILFTAVTVAQNQEYYKYVKVPEKFEGFDANEHQLNALAAFLFEKYGLEVFYKEKVPANVQPCDILLADVHNNSGLFRSKLYFTLKDCHGNIVLESEEGTSREKDYKASYHEALRKAFASVENWNLEKLAPEKRTVTLQLSSEDKENSEAKQVQKNPSETTISKSPEGEALFQNGGISFRLKKTNSGYDLYKNGEPEKFATLMKSGGGDNYIYSSKGVQGNAFFDPSGNLVVEYVESTTGLLTTVTYRKVDQ